MSIFTTLENFITTKAWPFIKNIGKDVVQAEITQLQPIAVAMVGSAETAIVQAAASGSLASLGTVLGDLVTKTATQAESAAITGGATSLLSAIGEALATNPNTANSLAVAAKPVATEAAPAA